MGQDLVPLLQPLLGGEDEIAAVVQRQGEWLRFMT
jgi:hypothetical protein